MSECILHPTCGNLSFLWRGVCYPQTRYIFSQVNPVICLEAVEGFFALPGVHICFAYGQAPGDGSILP